MDRQQLAALLQPLAELLRGVALQDAGLAAAHLNARMPLHSPELQAVREALEAGAAAGWLLPKENQGVRYGRVAKDLAGFSVDAVRMSGPAARHRHPNGEIDLLFAVSGSPHFDGHAPGWAVYPPGSEHVPTVTGGTMLILYFLPGGAIEWTSA
ncbi:MAG: DUF4863 family protein [Planctomycetes bacterium]|nr:DUF4863 family protein [Planctomycetota bacterium]